MSDAPAPRASWLTILGWACYLACSWTWCIGMFLPVLLIRDYGIWGFVVFAVPNVLGAAAMGWVLTSPEASRRLMSSHRALMGWFSIVTVFFQIFFLAWLLGWTGGLYWCVVWLGWLATSVFSARFLSSSFRMPLAVLCISLIALLAWIVTGHLRDWSSVSGGGSSGVGPLSGVCLFGFLFCPYLDLTFHRARGAQSTKEARWSFGLGFAVLFLAMIGFTAIYAPVFIAAAPAQTQPFASLAGVLLLLHFGTQLGFTTSIHSKEVGTAALASLSVEQYRTPLLVHLSIVMAALALGSVGLFLPDLRGMAFNEVVYRLLMAFYGLLFPAYVYLCMIPTWRSPRPPTRRHLTVWLGACALAAPAYWMGFIERVEWWLIPGLAVVLLARLLIPRAGSAPAELSGAPVPAPTHPPQLSGHARPER